LKVLVTGATGYLGAVAAAALAVREPEVVGLARSQRSANALRGRVSVYGRTSTGRAGRPPPKELLARSISPKKTMTSFESVPAACRRVTIAERSERFLSSFVPDESRASIIRTCSLRGFCRSG
jgi:hypothetical protein